MNKKKLEIVSIAHKHSINMEKEIVEKRIRIKNSIPYVVYLNIFNSHILSYLLSRIHI